MNKGLKWLIATMAVFAIATAIGAFCSIKCSAGVLYDYFKGLSGGEISIRIGWAVQNALTVWSVLFFSAFFKFGIVTSSLTIAYRGFVDGYAVASILRILGFRGLGLCFLDILGIPILIFMATNVLFCLTDSEMCQKGYIIRSVLLLVLLIFSTALSAFLADKIINWVLSGFEF